MNLNEVNEDLEKSGANNCAAIFVRHKFFLVADKQKSGWLEAKEDEDDVLDGGLFPIYNSFVHSAATCETNYGFWGFVEEEEALSYAKIANKAFQKEENNTVIFSELYTRENGCLNEYRKLEV